MHMGIETHWTLSNETKVFWDARPAVLSGIRVIW